MNIILISALSLIFLGLGAYLVHDFMINKKNKEDLRSNYRLLWVNGNRWLAQQKSPLSLNNQSHWITLSSEPETVLDAGWRCWAKTEHVGNPKNMTEIPLIANEPCPEYEIIKALRDIYLRLG